MRVNHFKRLSFLPMMAKRALSTGDKNLLSRYGITPQASATLFRNLSYDDIHAQGEFFSFCLPPLYLKFYAAELAEGNTVVSNGTVTVDTGLHNVPTGLL